MKKLLFLLGLIASTAISFAQTGTGILFLTDASYTFTPTTVDSTTVFDFQLVNTVGVSQTLYFDLPVDPFSLSDEGPIEIAANDTIDLSLSFTPASIGTFTGTLGVVGNIFGAAELALTGQGIQVVLEWTPSELAFDTTAIGQQSASTLSISSIGDGAGTISDVIFSNNIFSLDPSSSLSIAEGTTEDLTFLFSPVGAGVFNETVQLHTNDPNNPIITIPLMAVGISEVSGEVCDVTWSLADSPFTLTGSVTIPEGCSLTIDPGVVVNLNGFVLLVEGDFLCSGTASEPIQLNGGKLEIAEGAPVTLQYLQMQENGDLVYAPPYTMVYYNNFESSAGQFDFDCYDQAHDTYVTGSVNEYDSYGCNDFFRTSNSSWSLQSNTGDYYLKFYSSNGGDGYLYLDESPIAPYSGFYDFSFTYESDRYEQDCSLSIDVFENGQWVTLYQSPTDVESNSSLTRFARASHFFEAGGEMKFRIYHNVGYASGDFDQMWTYIDEVRLETSRSVVNELAWDFSNNALEFAGLISDYGQYAGQPRISIVDGVLNLNSDNTTISFNTSEWVNAPITVPEDGWYFIEIENRLLHADYNTNCYWDYKSSVNNSWYRILDNYPPYGSSYGPDTYEWRSDVVHSLEYLTAGSRIDFRYYGYYHSTYSSIEWEGRNFKIYQLDDSTSPIVFSDEESFALDLRRDATLKNFQGSNVKASENLEVSNSIVQGVLQKGNDSIEILTSEVGRIESLGGQESLNDVVLSSYEATSEEPYGGASELVYYNNFESSAHQYDFDCYDAANNTFISGTTDQYSSYGCDDFYRDENASWSLQSNDGDYYLRFFSNNGSDGYLYLAETPIAPEAGLYEFSFTYESSRYEQDCFMTVDVFDGENWVTLYQSPTDIESDSEFTRFARASYQFEEGEEMNFRIYHDVGYQSSAFDQMYTYIDEVRIELARPVLIEVVWDFDANSSDFENLVQQYGEWGDEPRVSIVNDALRLNADNSNISFNTSTWENAPIIVPEDGWYYIEIENRLLHADYNTNNYWEYKSSQDNNSWYRILDNFPQYSSSQGPNEYGWRSDVVHSVEYLTAGSRIDFNYYGYYHSTYSSIEWEGRNFRIYQLSDEANDEFQSIANVLEIQNSNLGELKTSIDHDVSLANTTVSGSINSGIEMTGNASNLELHHSVIENNAVHGILIESNEGSLDIENSIIAQNGGYGVNSLIPGELNYSTVAGNGQKGWLASSTGVDILTNCIFANNVGGSYSGVELSQFNYTSNYPQFQEGSYMLEPYSPCVDAAMPWHTDQHMPYGMGGLRADMGAYGGPNNAGWGGTPAPDGAALLEGASDTPQDQGYVVGLTFEGSPFDNSAIQNNVTHYAVWRHYDPTGEAVSDLAEGNWELLGTMPAQGFANYAYQAPALGNTNAFETFNSCYAIVAHTADENQYWYSNVICGEAIDNLAPESPDLNGLVLETGGTQISWTPPAEEDYAFTEIFSDAGFTASIGTDTVVVDLTAELGGPVTYTAVHYDVNGNASESSSLTLDVAVGTDVIQLNAGWNLISFDRSLTDASVAEVFSGLQPGNLQYVTGFQEGVQFYDPNGLSFLNTLGTLDDGYGYWVKVAADDVLEASGAGLPANYRPQLNAGWNLIGYPNATEADPAAYFADLIADENLVYVTGFDEGSQVFDPNGLAFLNTLQMLQNGFGYWVKTNAGEDLNGLAESQTKSSPTFMILNGHSDLQAAEGERVDVLNADGERVAQLEVLEGGYLMTSAVFGFDPAAPENGGLRTGDVLTFVCNGRTADQTITYQGDMTHRALELTFSDLDAASGFSVAPNPARAAAWVEVDLVSDARIAVQINDALGRTLREISFGDRLTGPQELQLDLTGLTPGAYELSLLLDGRISGSSRLLIQQ